MRNLRHYTVTPEHENHFIKAEVTPVMQTGITGKATPSKNFLCKPSAPYAEDVRISGQAFVGSTLEAEYSYQDNNSDIEGVSQFAWLRGDSRTGAFVYIEDANEQQYVLTESDIGKYIKFEVIPVANAEPFVGEKAQSDKFMGPNAPTVTQIGFDLNGERLKGKYVYSHPNGILERQSKCEWYIDGAYAGSGMTLDVDFKGKKSVKFVVTPVAVHEPKTGESVSVTKDVHLYAESGGGGERTGSGGGNASNSFVPLPSPTPVVQPETKPIHWAYEAITYVLENNIMLQGDGEFQTEEKITRAEFVSYIVKAMNLKTAAYQEIFKDIAPGDAHADEIWTAVEKGIVSKDELFHPNRNVSREEICKIVIGALAAVTGEKEIETGSISLYQDSALISEWAVPYVNQAIGANIMKGISEHEFSPKGQVTRAQTAVIIKRMVDYAKKKAGETSEIE